MMKYFRYYPWGLQLTLFLLMTFTFLSGMGAIVLSLLPKLSNYQYTDLSGLNADSPYSLVKTFLVVQGFNSVFMFLLPALTFAHLTHPQPAHYLGLRQPGKKIQWLLAVLVMAGAMPVLIGIENLMGMIDFGADAKAAQAANDNVFHALMKMPSFLNMLAVLFVVAVIPAIGEEFFFRGIFMRFARKRSRNMIFPILFSAAIFSFSHANINGYISIFLAGVLLAVIYNLTGSLWCSIVGHFFFNGFQIALSYLGDNNASIKALTDSDTMPIPIVIAGAIVFGISFYLLLKNRTPLPPNWTDDFSPAELEQMKEERKGKFL